MSLYLLKMEQALDECNLHISRISTAFQKLVLVFPLTEDKYKLLNDDQIQSLDQYAYRFIRLQHSIEKRIFPSLTSLLDGDDDARSYLDTLNILERHGIVESTVIWQEIKYMQTMLSQDYPQDYNYTANVFNELVITCSKILGVYKNIITYYSNIKNEYKS